MVLITLIPRIIPRLRAEFREIWTVWMFDHQTVRVPVARASEGADISIIEGVMGFFDGLSLLENTGSTAEISMIT